MIVYDVALTRSSSRDAGMADTNITPFTDVLLRCGERMRDDVGFVTY